MRDLIVILIVALLSTGGALWFLLRRPAANEQPSAPLARPSSATVGSEPPGQAAAPPKNTPTQPPTAATREASAGSPLAVLEFDAAPWRALVTRTEVMIGRHSEDDIRVPDVRVSRHHARLVAKRNGGFEIHNLTAVRSEPNPMLVNGEAREHSDIADGDVVTLGGVSFTFKAAA